MHRPVIWSSPNDNNLKLTLTLNKTKPLWKNKNHFSYLKKKNVENKQSPANKKRNLLKKNETTFQKIQNIKTKKNLQTTNKTPLENKQNLLHGVF